MQRHTPLIDPEGSGISIPVSLLLTDVEGSTQLWDQSPDEAFEFLNAHNAIADRVVTSHGGEILKLRGEGDSLFCVFPEPLSALKAAIEFQLRLQEQSSLRVRMAINTGLALYRDRDYFGPTVNRCARLRALAEGGQIVVSEEVHEHLADLGSPAGSVDLGYRWLKGLSQPERVYRITHPDFHQRGLGKEASQLPVQITSIIGRDEEQTELAGLITTNRLVSVIGFGGVGKTRLMLAALSQLQQEATLPIFLIDLATVPDGALLDQAIATGLRIRTDAGGTLRAAIQDWIGDQILILALDNCEHIAEACRSTMGSLVIACPKLSIVCTSRIPLELDGETTYRLAPLALPAADATLQEVQSLPIAQLFVARAVRTVPSFKLDTRNFSAVSEICRRLDGIPLAIELAAAMVRVMPVAQIAAKLSERFKLLRGNTTGQRHQTLETILDCSYETLSGGERDLLTAMSFFVGGLSYDAVDECWKEIGSSEMPPLAGLTDKSLVSFDLLSQRYSMLETVREYCQAHASDIVRHRYADFQARYLSILARELSAKTLGTDEVETYDRYEAEHENIRAAMDFLQGRNPLAAIDLGLSCWRYFIVRGYHWEAVERFANLQTFAGPCPFRMARITAVLAYAAYWGSDPDSANLYCTQALEFARSAGDPWSSALAYTVFGALAYHRNDVEGFLSGVDQALSDAEACEDTWLTAVLRYEIAGLKALHQPIPSEVGLSASGLATVGDGWFYIHAVVYWARLECQVGARERSRQLLRGALAQALELRSQQALVWALEGYADLVSTSNPELSIEVLSCADSVRGKRRLQPLESGYVAGLWDRASTSLSEGIVNAAKSRGHATSPDVMALRLLQDK